MKHPVQEGTLPGGLPFLAVGRGEPLVVFRHFAPNNANPVGFFRWSELRPFAGLMNERRIHLVSRRPGLDPAVTMADLAAQHDLALREHFGGPVDVIGVSTGGMVAQQLAADSPETLQRLALVGTACTVGDASRAARRDCVAKLRQGRRMAAYWALGPTLAVHPAGQVFARAVTAALEPFDRAHHLGDLIAVMNAEITFDLSDRLDRITAPVLVMAGDRDGSFPPELIRRTADRIPDSRLVVVPGAGRRRVLDSSKLVPELRRFFIG